MSDDLDLLSNLLSADIESDSQPVNLNENKVSLQTNEGKRKYTEDDGFMKELENDIMAKRKKLKSTQPNKNENLVKSVFGELSEDEDDPNNVFESKNEKRDYNLYSLSIGNSNNKTTWKSKVDPNKLSNTNNFSLNKDKKFDVYSEPIFNMRIINPCLSIQDLKYKMTGRQPVPMSKIKEHVSSSSVDSVDWVVGGVLVGKSLPKTSAKGSKYCIWTLSDLKPGLKIISLFLFGSAFTSLWKTNVGTVVGVLNPSVLENSKPNEEACLSVNNGDKVMCWGTSKDYATCKARKKDGENCSNFVNIRDCEFCVFHVKQEYKKYTGRSEFQSMGGGALTNLRNKVLGKNEVFYGGQSFSAFKPAKKSPKLVARDNKLLQNLSKSGVMVSSLANNMPARSTSSSFNSSYRGKLIEDAERMRRLSGKPVHVGAKLPGEEASTNTMTFKNIFKQTPSTSNTSCSTKIDNQIIKNTTTVKSKNDASNFLITNTIKHSGINDKVTPSNSKMGTCNTKLKETKNSNNDFFDFEGEIQFNKSNLIKSQANCKISSERSNRLNDSSSLELSKSSCEVIEKNSTQSSESKQNTFGVNEKKCTINGGVSQAQSNIAEYFAKKSSSPNVQEGSSKRIVLSKDLRERKKQIIRAKAESLIKYKGGIEKQNPNSLKKNISNVMSKSMDLEIEVEGEEDKKVDLFKEMMKKTSRHMDLVDEAHRREEEEYFEKLEKKEQMEEKMMTTFKVECKAVRCNECKYTWFSASDLCKKERHTLKIINTFKRFFKCCNCSNRTISFDVVPLRPCKHCGVTNWARAPMMKERKVNLESHLSIRGDESKYLNSMQSIGEASLNLLVPE